MKAIILAGGFGTRLQTVVKDVPKPMANINGKPFLEYLFRYLSKYEITDVVFSVGYKQEIIKNYFKKKFQKINIVYSCENEPLGTGGAIKQALGLLDIDKNENILVLNGDTFFDIDLDELIYKSSAISFDMLLCIKNMYDFYRYGTVVVNDSKVVEFKEKAVTKQGYINCGVYVIKQYIFDTIHTNSKFSFEDFMEQNLHILDVSSYISNNSYFIDIGIPNDYEKAKKNFKEMF